MERQREERNLRRMNFLKDFYGDLNNEDATKLSKNTGNEYVMVRLEGMGKFVWMSGLINPQKRIAVKE